MIIEPIRALLSSRKFVVFLTAFVVDFLIAHFPALGQFQEPLFYIVPVLAFAVIGGIAWEDAAEKGRSVQEVLLDNPSWRRPLGETGETILGRFGRELEREINDLDDESSESN